jgi:hypothetical protein
VIVADFHATGVSVIPLKAYAPLVVDAYAPLPGMVALQDFQAIVRRDAQIFDPLRVVEHTQLAPCHFLNLVWSPARKFVKPGLACFAVEEVGNHEI